VVEGIDLVLELLVSCDARRCAEAAHVRGSVFPVGEVDARLWPNVDGEKADLVKVGIVVVKFVDRGL